MKIKYKNEHKCQLCGESFPTLTRFGNHIYITHGVSVETYYNKFIKKDSEGICPVCGKQTKFTGKLSLGYHTFCSNECKLKAGVNKPAEELICKICNLPIEGKIFSGQMRCFSTHLKKTHNINDIKIYYDKYLKKPNEGICIYCGKPTNYRSFSVGYLKSCSTTCGLLASKKESKIICDEIKKEKEKIQSTQADLIKDLRERVQQYEWTGDRNTILFNEIDLTKSDYHSPEEENTLHQNELDEYDGFVSELSWL